MTLKVIHRLQAFSNAIRRTFVQHFTRFQPTVCSHGSSALAELLVLIVMSLSCRWDSIVSSRPLCPMPMCACVCMCMCVQTSQMLARVRPCSSRALCLLGSAQLALYDCQTNASNAAAAAELLEDAKQSFSASVALEGRPAAGEPPPEISG